MCTCMIFVNKGLKFIVAVQQIPVRFHYGKVHPCNSNTLTFANYYIKLIIRENTRYDNFNGTSRKRIVKSFHSELITLSELTIRGERLI